MRRGAAFQAEGIARAGVWGRCVLGTGGKARKPVRLGGGCEEGQTEQTADSEGPTGQNGAFPLNGMGGQEGFGMKWQNSCTATESF